jgi:hypothetical protein
MQRHCRWLPGRATPFQLNYANDTVTGSDLDRRSSLPKTHIPVNSSINVNTVDQRIDWATVMAFDLLLPDAVTSRNRPLPVSSERPLNGNSLSNPCLSLTRLGTRRVGSILRAILPKGRRWDIALGLACASWRDHLRACVHFSLPSSKVCRDLACTLASARGAAAPLRTPRAAYAWGSRCTNRLRLSSDELPQPDGPRQLCIDVADFRQACIRER